MKFISPKLAAVVLVTSLSVGCSDSLSENEQALEDMRNDLAALVTAQEQHFQQTGAYTIDSETIFTPTQGVLISMKYVRSNGWGAEAAKPGSPDHCAIWVGSLETSFQSRWAPINEGVVKCKPIPDTGK